MLARNFGGSDVNSLIRPGTKTRAGHTQLLLEKLIQRIL